MDTGQSIETLYDELFPSVEVEIIGERGCPPKGASAVVFHHRDLSKGGYMFLAMGAGIAALPFILPGSAVTLYHQLAPVLGVFLMLAGVYQLITTTFITINETGLHVARKPLPLGGFSIPLADIRKVRVVHKNGSPVSTSTTLQRSSSYSLETTQAGGAQRTILRNLPDPGLGERLATAIRRTLGR